MSADDRPIVPERLPRWLTHPHEYGANDPEQPERRRRRYEAMRALGLPVPGDR